MPRAAHEARQLMSWLIFDVGQNMNAAFRIQAVTLMSAVVALAHAGESAPEKRLFAAWEIVQADGFGDVHYFYPDGLFVRQGMRRREFVSIGHWRVEEKKHLVLFDLESRNTTLSAKAIASIKAKKEVFELTFESDEKMRWMSVSGSRELKRLGDLPNRTENIYWGLGTAEDYERAIRREKGLPPKQTQTPNKAPEPTTGAVTPRATEATSR